MEERKKRFNELGKIMNILKIFIYFFIILLILVSSIVFNDMKDKKDNGYKWGQSKQETTIKVNKND